MATTLKDIAAELNLSVTAVSRALRSMPDISAETTLLVKQTAERMEYHKNQAARCLKTNKSMTVGIIVTDISNPVFSSLYKSIERVCTEHNYVLMLGNSNENEDVETIIINNMLEYGIDGLFLIPCMVKSPAVNNIIRSKIPCISLQRKLATDSLISVQSNDFEGGYIAAQYLYSRNYRKFLYVTAPFHISSAQERYDGFISFLKEKHISTEHIEVITCDTTREGSYYAFSNFLTSHPDSIHLENTAIFCFSDYLAYGVYEVLFDKGYSVPEDVAVVGYDNIEFSNIIQPGLTTIDIQPQEVGTEAAKIMMNLLTNNITPSPTTSIHPKLIIRNSTQ